MGHSSAAPVIVSDTVDTELIAYFADCKNYSEKDLSSVSRMQINTHCWLQLPGPVVSSEAHNGTCILSLWTADSKQEKSAD